MARDPVCGMTVDPAAPRGGSFEHHGTTYVFCNPGCRQKFAAAPERYLQPSESPSGPAGPIREYTCPMHPEVVQREPGSCPICGMALEPRVATLEQDRDPELGDMQRRL